MGNAVPPELDPAVDWSPPRKRADWAKFLTPFERLPHPTLRTVVNFDLGLYPHGTPEALAILKAVERLGYVYVASAGWVHLMPDRVPDKIEDFRWRKGFIIWYCDVPAEVMPYGDD